MKLTNFPVRKLKTLTLRSIAKVANFIPFGENSKSNGIVLDFANTNKSVSSFDSNATLLGNLNSFFNPVQYSVKKPIDPTPTLNFP